MNICSYHCRIILLFFHDMRPHKERIIDFPPLIDIFKPAGIPKNKLEEVFLRIDEFEAVRLADYLGLSHEESAKNMGISRPTFTRLIENAHKKISDALINGKALLIEGGNIHFRNNIFECKKCNHRIITSIDFTPIKCPKCGNLKLKSKALSYGHGECCKKVIEKLNKDKID